MIVGSVPLEDWDRHHSLGLVLANYYAVIVWTLKHCRVKRLLLGPFSLQVSHSAVVQLICAEAFFLISRLTRVFP